MRVYFSLHNFISLVEQYENYKKSSNFGLDNQYQIFREVFSNANRFFITEPDKVQSKLNKKDQAYWERGMDLLIQGQKGENSSTSFVKNYKSSLEEMNLEEITSVYLCSDDEKLKHHGRKKSLIVCTEIGKELEALEKLYNFDSKNYLTIAHKEYDPDEYKDDGRDIYWEKRLNSIQYFTDIFIDDPYFFRKVKLKKTQQEYSKEKKEELTKKNNDHINDTMVSILTAILKGNNSEKINIVIRTAADNDPKHVRDFKIDKENFIEKIQNLLSKNKSIKNKKINLTIISNWGYRNLTNKAHDRSIITNYDFFLSGIGFKLFDEENKFKIFGKEPGEHFQHHHKIRKEMKKRKSKLFKKIEDNLKLKDIKVFGNKKSNFINFPSN